MSGDVQSEGLYLAFFLAACASLWPALRDADPRRAAWAGAFSGLAYLTRPEGLGVALVGTGLLALLVATGRCTLRRGAGVGLALAFGATLFVVPYVGALYAETGELWLTRKKSVAWVAGVDGPPVHFSGEHSVEPDWEAVALERGMERPNAGIAEAEREPDAAARAEAVPQAEPQAESDEETWSTAAERALAALGDLLRSAYRSFRYEMFLLLLPGLWAVRGPPGLRAAMVGALLVAYGLVLFGLAFNVGYVSQRHTLPPLALLLGYAAFGVGPWAQGLGRAFGRPLPWLAVAVGALAVATAVGAGKSLRTDRTDGVAERRAAEWLRDQEELREPGGHAGAIAARKRRIAYYGEAPFVQLRAKSPARMLHYLDSYDVGWVVVNQADVAGYDGMRPLMPRFLEPVHRVEAHGETALVLRYRSPRWVDAAD